MPTVQEKAKKEIIASPEGFKQEQMAEVGTEGVFRTQIKTPIW